MADLLNPSGKTAFVTGSSQDIGFAPTNSLAHDCGKGDT